MKQRYYFDHNASTPLHPDVITEMTKHMSDFGNPSSPYKEGQHSRELIEIAREQVANLVDCSEDQVLFLPSGSMANNLIIKQNYSEIITSQTEHASILEACKHQEKQGLRLTYLPCHQEGIPTIDDIKDSISICGEKTNTLLSIMMANNETGNIAPVADFASLAKEEGLITHSDASQAAGKIPVAFRSSNLDYMSLSAHKIAGPKGIGALIIGHPNELTPLSHGGPQEGERHAGTENLLGIIGFGKAAEIAAKRLDDYTAHTSALKKELVHALSTLTEHQIFSSETSLPNTLNIAFKGVNAESLVMRMDMNDISISTGSACATGSTEPSHVLSAMGIDNDMIKSAIRISLGHDSTKEGVNALATSLIAAINSLR